MKLLHPADMNFPDPASADKEGLVAIGGTLSKSLLLKAYSSGIFPWYMPGQPVLWWCPDPRMVVLLDGFGLKKSLRKLLTHGEYHITKNNAFREVIGYCARIPRKGQGGTWITPEMVKAYIELHQCGYAHSWESWKDGKLVGGLYGLEIGKVFFGESMFHLKTNASKAAFAALVEDLQKRNFSLIDAQQETGHLRSLGAVSISRDAFIGMLKKHIAAEQT